MQDEAMRALAESAGLALRWVDNDGRSREVGRETASAALAALGLPANSPEQIRNARALLDEEARRTPSLVVATVGESVSIAGAPVRDGFARIAFEGGGARDLRIDCAGDALRLPPLDRIGYHRLAFADREMTVAVAPASAYRIAEAAEGRRAYGLSAQIYGLRADDDEGFGNFGAVAALAAAAAHHGADALALSPAHALFSADNHHFSPYSPSSRLFLNALYADPKLIFGDDRIASVRTSIRLEPREAEDGLIDWPSCAQARMSFLRALFRSFCDVDLAASSPLASDFLRFRAERGADLEAHAVFEALHAHMFGRDFTKWSWRDWPDGLADAHSPAVAGFARAHPSEIAFHAFLQWLADRSMARAQGVALAGGMRIGLISDLAVGLNGGGSQAWSRPDDFLIGLSVGAPPDMLAPLGQNWGLTTFSPRALRAGGFEPFVSTLRAALRNAGGVRIDHILGLVRLWLVPDGAEATEGVYLAYPFEELVALLRLESARHRAVVIGEDLGTVPHGLRERLGAAGIAGLRVFQFERDGGGFRPPDWYPREAVAMTSTHDTATIAGWWTGADIALRAQAGQLPAGRSAADCEAERDGERRMAWDAFRSAGVASGDAPSHDAPEAIVAAAAAFVARSPADLVILPVEDALGRIEQPNLPGTTTQHPNWRRRYAEPTESMLDASETTGMLEILSHRGR
ncbi:MAG: 4-alpha-glucanotransferase [Hyphomicrobiales bacterium]|nr:4-alpha-glucanotransferase [Hyphomicrobiales bacterium]